MLIIFNVIFIAFIAAIIIFIKQYRIKKRSHLRELETIDVLHKKELLKTQMEIQSQTMKYIGREIHDNIGQKLTLSSLYLQQLVFENKAKTQDIMKNIDTVNNIINESLTELRLLSKTLTDDTVDKSTISELIKIECKKIEVLKTHNVVFNNNLNLILSSYQTKSILLRITQEFLQNSIKHANCDCIEISIFNTNNILFLVLKDNGDGFDIENVKTNGIGLKNMKKRIEMINGKFEIKSDSNGTVFTIEIPL
ncbi:ATP-binding protein [uncultured Tenacibaculum sp.]|uniref:sensor histidine kinase n=1 Tax=uncultured Tenacibaculum sp. TaxID=174713 RepID=UPI002605B146|nr:ATP-binding protein [uncultured Tenacibaculum sp.]